MSLEQLDSWFLWIGCNFCCSIATRRSASKAAQSRLWMRAIDLQEMVCNLLPFFNKLYYFDIYNWTYSFCFRKVIPSA